MLDDLFIFVSMTSNKNIKHLSISRKLSKEISYRLYYTYIGLYYQSILNISSMSSHPMATTTRSIKPEKHFV